MKKTQQFRLALMAWTFAVALWGGPPVKAESEDVVELQTQIQILHDLVQRMQSSLDAHLGVLQNLMQQTTNSVGRSSQGIAAIQQNATVQNNNFGGTLDICSGKIQSLNDSVNELHSRVDRLADSIQDVQSQLQEIQSSLRTAGTADTSSPGVVLSQQAPNSAGNLIGGAEAASPLSLEPPLRATFQAALSDYYAARYGIAKGEFQEVIQYYPESDLAGTAEFYLGEIEFSEGNFSKALKDYRIVIQQYSGNPREPTAELHQAYALLRLDRCQKGIEQLRSLIRRYPDTPEAADARRKLRSIGKASSTPQP